MAEGLTGPPSLGHWLDRAQTRDFIHCAAFAADWMVARTGQHPAPHILTWGARCWLRHLRQSGGLIAAVRPVLGATGWRETPSPGAGDVGLVNVPISATRQRLVCAVLAPSGRWALRPPGSGLVFMKTEPVCAWGC